MCVARGQPRGRYGRSLADARDDICRFPIPDSLFPVCHGRICPALVPNGSLRPPTDFRSFRAPSHPEATMLSTNDIPLSESALLVVDAQDSFKVDPKWERRNNREFERNVGALIDAYRAAGRPVIFFLHTDDDPGFERGNV